MVIVLPHVLPVTSFTLPWIQRSGKIRCTCTHHMHQTYCGWCRALSAIWTKLGPVGRVSVSATVSVTESTY